MGANLKAGDDKSLILDLQPCEACAATCAASCQRMSCQCHKGRPADVPLCSAQNFPDFNNWLEQLCYMVNLL
jgi:hypothetical protein